ncbi:MAG TPA: antibiotic biosynthesis monooxygenase family protein [Acidimicrobiales bacterium]|jgi:quinol monooxygenase YgiN
MLEHAVLEVRAGEEAAFEDSARLALPLIESAPGCHGAEFRRQAENPSIYLLLVRWSSIEAHTEFRETDLYQRWRELTHPYYVGTLDVTHFFEPIPR